MTLPRITGAISVVAILLAACSTGGAATPSPAAATSSAAVITLTVVNTTSNGLVLVGPTGKALYVHQGDSASTSTCTGGCLQAWPALTVAAGSTVVANPAVPGTFATFVRSDDGSIQVTYEGRPVYYWTGDAKPGDVTGHGVNGFAVVSLPGSQPAATPCQSSCSPASASPRY